MPTKPLPYETPWSAPVRGTVLEDAVRRGLKRITNPTEGIPAKTGDVQRALATTQNQGMGLLQALSAPVQSIAAPLMEAASPYITSALPGLLNAPLTHSGPVWQKSTKPEYKMKDLVQDYTSGVDTAADTVGYPRNSAQELVPTVAGLLAGPALKGLGAAATRSAEALGPEAGILYLAKATKDPEKLGLLSKFEAAEPDPRNTPQKLWKRYGLFRHPQTGKVLTEVSDRGMKLKIEPYEIEAQLKDQADFALPLSEFISHPAAFAQQPLLKDFGVMFDQYKTPAYLPLNFDAGLRAGRYIRNNGFQDAGPMRGMINLRMADASGGGHNRWLDDLAHEISHASDNLIKGHHRGEGDPDLPFEEYRRNSGEVAAFNATHARRSPDSVLTTKLPNERRLFGDIPYSQQRLGDVSNGPDSLGWKTYNQHSAHLSQEVIDLIDILMDR